MPGQQQARRVAVLGGGPAALAAAFALSDPARSQPCEVTVYQPGWRLGGKCASGRNQAEHRGMRIEEHGLHVWFGFYENAFSVIRETYKQLERAADHPLATFEQAFVGCDEIVLFDRQGAGWQSFSFKVPSNALEPGVRSQPLPGFWDIARRVVEWTASEYLVRIPKGPPPGTSSFAAGTPDIELPPFLPALLTLARSAQEKGTAALPREPLLATLPPSPAAGFLGIDPEHEFAKLLGNLRNWLWSNFSALFEKDARARLFFTMFDTFASGAIGIVEDDVLTKGWESINSYDLADWLHKRGGALPITIGNERFERSPMLRSIYDVAFGYREGDVSKPDIAAGTALNDYLRLQFTYRGHLMWKMQAGMGDAVIAPLYLLLKRRGVQFKFFHAAQALRLDAAGTAIEEIDIVPQLGPNVDVSNYQPLIEVPERSTPSDPPGLECWPTEPLWSTLPGTEAAAESGHDYEQEPNPDGVEPFTLRRGTADGFDDVVLAIPVAALPPICKDLSAKLPAFKKMLDKSETIATQAFQLWFTESLGQLGWTFSGNSVAGCYVEPIDTWADMTHLIARERWVPADGVGGIAYFCGVLEDEEGETRAHAYDRVKENALKFLVEHLGPLFPKAMRAGRIDWASLADPGREVLGPARLESQYWRANVAPSERYVLTPAGSVEHRLAPGGSGIPNLALAGDWTLNGIDGGCVEAAMTSGLQAASYLSQGADDTTGQKLTGTDPRWLSTASPGPLSMAPPSLPDDLRGGTPARRTQSLLAPSPEYVEYGARTTAPPPFSFEDGRFRGYLLKGDAHLIELMCDRVLGAPANGVATYKPMLGPFVLLQVGHFGKIYSEDPRFSSWGYAEESQLSLFIPVLARGGGAPARVCMFCPFMIVDNPVSMAGGREIYGYPKTLGVFDPSTALGDPLRVEAFGGNFDPADRAEWRPLLTIARTATGAALSTSSSDVPKSYTLEETLPLLGCLSQLAELVSLDLGAVEAIIRALALKQSQQVFLKQFRDAQGGPGACYRAIVEAPLEYLSSKITPSLEQWEVVIDRLDSDPIASELGIVSPQITRLTFDAQMRVRAPGGRIVTS